MKSIILVVVALTALHIVYLHNVCLADIVNCNGEWTNKPCDKKVEGKIPEKPLDERLTTDDYPQKKQILASVSAYTIELSNLGLTFPSQDIRDYCLKKEISVTDCQKNFDQVRTSFHPTVEAAQARAKQERLKENTAATKASDTEKPSAPAATSVTIIDANQGRYHDIKPHFPLDHEHFGDEDDKPKFDHESPAEHVAPIEDPSHPRLNQLPSEAKKPRGGAIAPMSDLDANY